MQKKHIVTLMLTVLAVLIVFFQSDPLSDFQPIWTQGFDNFKIDSVLLIERKEGKVLFSLRSDEIVHRKRTSKLFVYQNLKEIYMKNVSLDIYPQSGQQDQLIPINMIGDSFRVFGGSAGASRLNEADIDLNLLTRVILDNVSISVYLPNNKRVTIDAGGILINKDFRNIIFTGSVRIASHKKTLLASKAIWSDRFNGIYFPDGYMTENTFYQKKDFFRVNSEGRFCKVSFSQKIDDADMIEEAEEALNKYLIKNMPQNMKVLVDPKSN